MANVAGEISGALHPDHLRLIAGDIDNFEFTRLDDKELRDRDRRRETAPLLRETFSLTRQRNERAA